MQKYCVMLLVVALFLPQWVQADIPAAFVDIGYGARPMGMGGAFVALADDGNAILWNPAGLTHLRQPQLNFMYAKQLSLIPYYLVTFGHSFAQTHGQGIAVLTSGNLELRETTFIVAYAFSWKYLLIQPFDGISAGVNLKYRMASFGQNEDGGETRSQGSATGYGLDLGMLWQWSPRLAFGIFARDVVNTMTYNNTTRQVKYSESVPPALLLGTAYHIYDNWVIAADLDKSLASDTKDKLSVGSEYRLLNILLLRCGFTQNLDVEVNRKYSLGLGLRYHRGGLGIQFDFAYLFSDLANTPRVSTSIYF